MKAKTKSCVISIVGVIVFIGVVCLAGFLYNIYINSNKKQYEYAVESIKKDTDIDIPSDSELLFRVVADGFQCYWEYNVLIINNVSEEWLAQNNFTFSNYDGIKTYNKSAFHQYFDSLNIVVSIPNEYIPNFEDDHYWLESRDTFSFYNPNSNELVVYDTDW